MKTISNSEQKLIIAISEDGKVRCRHDYEVQSDDLKEWRSSEVTLTKEQETSIKTILKDAAEPQAKAVENI